MSKYKTIQPVDFKDLYDWATEDMNKFQKAVFKIQMILSNIWTLILINTIYRKYKN